MPNDKRQRDWDANLAKDRYLNPERARKKIRKRRKRKLLIALGILLGVLIVLFTTFHVLRAMGKNKLQANAASKAPSFEDAPVFQEVTEAEKESVGWQEGWVKYDGEIWSYNEDITTLLIMGIDKSGEAVEVAEGTNGGQADGLFLLVLNPHTKKIRLLAINRNAMADVDVYDEQGAYVRTVKAQICTQHGFGNGLAESCEYQKKAVERYLYQLPIHGYAAINMTSVGPITDAVGGIDVRVLEDMTKWDKRLVKDEIVHLEGKLAYIYATRRDTKIAGSADGRLARQKQYLTAFMGKAVSRIKKNPMSALDLYNALTKEMTTDITADVVTYLAPQAAKYEFDSSILTLEGETVLGEDGFEEFHADEEALYRLLLDVFYERVEQG